jgi:rare lipoprotein A
LEEEGFASYYGAEFHGRRTSSGEVFNMHELTAAHRELPMGTWIMVTNLGNGRSVEVRVNDRGPFVSDRIVDLSYAAGKLLGMIGPGVVPVRVAVTRLVSSDGGGPPRLSVRYTVQVASFISPENARVLEGKLSEEFSDVEVVRKMVGGETYFRVWLGNFPRREDAQSMAEKLTARGLSVLIIERDR